jgi:hypothetical protein
MIATEAATGIAVFRGPRKREAMKPGKIRPGIPKALVKSRRFKESREVKEA